MARCLIRFDISGDGTEIVSVELSSGEGPNSAIYLRRTDPSPAVRLGYGAKPALSIDAKWVACVHRERDNSRLLVLRTGVGEEKLLSTGAIQPETVQWFFDDKHLLFTGNEPKQPPRTYVFDLGTERIKPVTTLGERASGISPNGEFAAIVSRGKLSLPRQRPFLYTPPVVSRKRFFETTPHESSCDAACSQS